MMQITPPVSDNTEWYDLDFASAPEPKFWTVAVYLCDRAWGGPEEGGWWYDTGTRVDDPREYGDFLPKICATEAEAYEYAKAIQSCMDRPGGINNQGGQNRDLSSVNCIGRYMAEVYAGYPPAGYPERRPHYE